MDGWQSTRKASSIAAPALLTWVLIGGGCDTIASDFNAFADSLVPKSPSEAARDMVDQYDPDKRREGLTLISTSVFGNSPPQVAVYRDYVRDTQNPLNTPLVRAMAIRALARHGQPDDALLIAPNLSDENLQVRWEAAKGLQRLHNPAAVPELLKTLAKSSEDVDVRTAAATALGQYPRDDVVQGLIGAIDERELSLNLAAEQSLKTLTGKDLGLDSRAWFAWYAQAEPANEAFATQIEYLYPVYGRDVSWLEKAMFWTQRNFETAGIPAGLRPEGQRSTYENDQTAEEPPPSNDR